MYIQTFVTTEINRIMQLSGADRYNSLQDFHVTRKQWHSWNEITRQYLDQMIPQFTAVYMRYNPDSNREQVELDFRKWLK